MAAFPAQAGGALQPSYHGHRAGSAAPEEGLTLIHPPAKRPSGRANPCHAASFKSLDIKVAPFLCLALVSTLQKAGQPGCGASPPLESLAHLTWLELPNVQFASWALVLPVRAGLGRPFPPFQHHLGTCSSLPHQSLPKLPMGPLPVQEGVSSHPTGPACMECECPPLDSADPLLARTRHSSTSKATTPHPGWCGVG